MNKINSYVPSVILLAVALAVLFGGPQVMRELAYAQEQGRVQEARQRLQSGPLLELNEAFSTVARVVEPSVAHISVRRKVTAAAIPADPFSEIDPQAIPEPYRRFFEGPRRPRAPEQPNPYEQFNVPREVGNGSGWVYQHANGRKYVITNNHVVEGADKIVAVFHNQVTADATVLGRDPQTDIAVLEIKDQSLLHPARLADKPVQQGEIVFAFGSPLHFEFSMSQGIVSGHNRRLGILGSQGYEDFIQTDAAINPGNSGGPLVNVYGQVVGMNSAIATPTRFNSGLGFAIPADMIEHVVGQLIEEGKVRRGYLGIYFQELDPVLAGTFGYEGSGVLVERLAQGSPAAEAGIEPEDIISQVEGKPVLSGQELRDLIARTPPGTTVKMTVFRDGTTREVQVKLGEQPAEMAGVTPGERRGPQRDGPSEGAMEALRKLGLERLATITEEVATEAGLDKNLRGVLVLGVRPGSVAEVKLFERGLVITHVQSQPVTTVEELAEEVAKSDLQKGVRFRVMDRTGAGHYIALNLP